MTRPMDHARDTGQHHRSPTRQPQGGQTPRMSRYVVKHRRVYPRRATTGPIQVRSAGFRDGSQPFGPQSSEYLVHLLYLRLFTGLIKPATEGVQRLSAAANRCGHVAGWPARCPEFLELLVTRPLPWKSASKQHMAHRAHQDYERHNRDRQKYQDHRTDTHEDPGRAGLRLPVTWRHLGGGHGVSMPTPSPTR